MTSIEPLTRLQDLPFLPYLNPQGHLPEELQGQVGVYAIFDQTQALQFIGYSRDVALSLRQHLVRQPTLCHWLKVHTIDRPSRSLLEATREAWIGEHGNLPPGNQPSNETWTQPIDAKSSMSPEEQQQYQAGDSLDQVKLLKQIARRVEADIFAKLEARGFQEAVRFNPKLKEQGLLDLK